MPRAHEKKGTIKVKTVEKRPKKHLTVAIGNRVLKKYWLCNYQKLSRAYENLNPALVKVLIELCTWFSNNDGFAIGGKLEGSSKGSDVEGQVPILAVKLALAQAVEVTLSTHQDFEGLENFVVSKI